MAKQTGPAAAAVQALQATLATQQATAADADRTLAAALTDAHDTTVQAVNRLEALAAEIDDGVANPAGFAGDTPLGAREFQKFLIAKQREILAVVSEAHQLDGAQRARVEALRAAYMAAGRD